MEIRQEGRDIEENPVIEVSPEGNAPLDLMSRDRVPVTVGPSAAIEIDVPLIPQ